MKRTQIYLDDAALEYLREESKLEHKSISEIIRESIHDRMKHNKNNIKSAVNEAFGIWENRDFDTEEYVRKLRRDRQI